MSDTEENQPLNEEEPQDYQLPPSGLALGKQPTHLQKSDSEANSYEIMEDGLPDFTKEKEKSTFGLALFNYISSALGLGDLGLPKALSQTGYGLGLVGLIICAFTNNYVMKLLIKTADRRRVQNKVTYESLAEDYFGRWGSRSVKASLLIWQFGTAVSCILFMNKFLDYTLCGDEPEKYCNTMLTNIIVISIIVFPMIIVDNYHYFAFAGFVGTIFTFIGILAQAIYNYNILQSGEGLHHAVKTHISDFKFEGFPLFFGVAITSFGTIGSLFQVRRSMRMPRKLTSVMMYSSLIMWVLYTFYSGIVYLAHREHVPDIALITLPQTNKFYLLAQFLYMISVGLTYPMQFVVAIHIMENSSSIKPKLFDANGRTRNAWVRYGSRYLIQILCMILGLVLDSLSLFLNMIGCFLTAYLLFVLPVMIYHKDRDGQYPTWKKIFHGVLAVFGIFVGVTGVILSIKEMIGFDEDPVQQSTIKY